MIEELPPYSDYKDSGLPWLGKVPSHWVLKRGKSYLTCINQRSEAGKEELLTVSSARGVVPRNTAKVTMFKAESYTGYKLCWPGDLVINSLWAWGGGLGVSQHHGIVSTAYSVYRGRPSAQINPRFLHELVRSAAFNWELHVRSKGIWISRLQLTDISFLDAPIPLPPSDEQAAIVCFLDHATRRLDQAIRAKRKIIALLNEQKQAIIHSAVTRGLDPDVPIKDSGIPWLGQIPAHWDTPLNQRIFKEEIRPHGGVSETQLSLSQRDGLIATHDMQERSLQTVSFDTWKVTIPGDLVLNRFKAHLGVFFAATLRGIVSFHYGVFAPRCALHTKYFELLFHTYPYRAIFAGRSNGMTVGLQNLSNQNFYNVRCAVPPFSEQLAIVAYAERETQALNTAIVRIEREIELLREYRTRLIADVVTGKLDVREAAARLPAEAEMPADEPELDENPEDDAVEKTA